MMNSIDDYLFDIVRDEHVVDLTQEDMADIVEQSLQLARHRIHT